MTQSVRETGYVVPALETALWAFYKTNSFREGALTAVNSVMMPTQPGAVFGQLAGAFYGLQGIPEEWRTKIFSKQLIENYESELYQKAQPT